MYNGKVQNYLSTLGLRRTEIKKKKNCNRLIPEKSPKEVSLGLDFEEVWHILWFGSNWVYILGNNEKWVWKELMEDIKH